MAEDTAEGARGTDAWGTNGADATDEEEGRCGESQRAERARTPRESHRVCASPMSEDGPASGSVQDVAAVALQASRGGETLFDRRRRSYLSQQLSGAPQATGLTARTATRALRVPPSSSLFDFVVDGGGLGGDAVVAVRGTIAPIGSEKTGDPRVGEASLAAPGRSTPDRVCGSLRAFGTSPPPQPRGSSQRLSRKWRRCRTMMTISTCERHEPYLETVSHSS